MKLFAQVLFLEQHYDLADDATDAMRRLAEALGDPYVDPTPSYDGDGAAAVPTRCGVNPKP